MSERHLSHRAVPRLVWRCLAWLLRLVLAVWARHRRLLLVSRDYRSGVGAVAASVVQQSDPAELAASLIVGVLAVRSVARKHRRTSAIRRWSTGR